jgi:hypothetical protein
MFSIAELSLASLRPGVPISMPWFGIGSHAFEFGQMTVGRDKRPAAQ